MKIIQCSYFLLFLTSCFSNNQLENEPLLFISSANYNYEISFDEKYADRESFQYLERRLKEDRKDLYTDKVAFVGVNNIKLAKIDTFLILYSQIAVTKKYKSQAKSLILKRLNPELGHWLLPLYGVLLHRLDNHNPEDYLDDSILGLDSESLVEYLLSRFGNSD